MKYGNLGLCTIEHTTDYLLFGDKTDKHDTLAISTHGIEKKTQKKPKE